MNIISININNLRNHLQSSFDFSNETNILVGMNGMGKTTVLEAISIAALTKSFLPTQDAMMINKDQSYYIVNCVAETNLKTNYKISLKYERGCRKIISGTEGDNLLPKNIIGIIPIVILSPDYKSITFGSPQDRRDFIDRILAQASKKYINDILRLKKYLKQRNSLLNNAKKNNFFDKNLFDSWTEIFIKTSAEILMKRKSFINEFTPYFKEIYSKITNSSEEVELIYQPDNFDSFSDDIVYDSAVANYKDISEKLFKNELLRGTTLFGPQKDEIVIKINGGIAKDFASQGQHKSLLISMKFAEFNFLKNIKNETPIILLDDIFAELDSTRSELVLNMLRANKSQTFITLTNREFLRNEFFTSRNIKYFEFNKGNIIH